MQTNIAPKYFHINPDYERSSGSNLFDKNTNIFYLDAIMMFSSLPLGYNHQIFTGDFEKEIASLYKQKVSNTLFENEYEKDLIVGLQETSGYEYFHFCATGALAVESAIKVALYKSEHSRKKVLSLRGSFHGINSWGVVTDRSIEPIKSRLRDFPSFEWPVVDISSLIQILESSSDLAALIIEPIQCTTGDNFLSLEILQQAIEVCYHKNICVIFDEIQTGMGTTGDYWYSLANGFKPDIIVFGKKVQVSGIMLSPEYSNILADKSFPLSVTFDGDIVDMLRAKYILRAIKSLNYLNNIKQQSDRITSFLSQMKLNYRAAGSIIAFDLKDTKTRDNFALRAFEKGLLINKGGTRTIRMRPNLAITDSEVEKLISILREIFYESVR